MTRHAAAPRPPEASPALQKAEGERRAYLHQREGLEKRSMLRGLILLAALVVVFALFRAIGGDFFPNGWYRQW